MTTKKIIQFGYNVRVPENMQLIDCRVLPNPYPKFAHDRVAARHAVRSHDLFPGLVQDALYYLNLHETTVIGVGCGYGVHRSGAVVEEILKKVRYSGYYDVEVENWGKA